MSKGLILDGGGVFGIGQAEILSKVKSLSKFDFIAGTSIGSVVGAIVASGNTVACQELPKFFDDTIPDIFAGYWWRHYNPFTPRYPDSALNSALKQLFPGFLRDVRIPLFITTVDLNKRALKVYFSGDPLDGAVPLWEVIRQAVAAESFFIPYSGLADGGILANNPVMVGVAGAHASLGFDIEEMDICSIGTGQRTYNTSVGTTRGWTLLGWGSYLLDSTLSGSASRMHEFFVSEIGLHNYLRIQFLRDDGWNMDNPAMVAEARAAWAKDIQAAIPKVEAF